ncbi:hypothetical protein BGW41_007887, partial [Actinomortierella wolfii]
MGVEPQYVGAENFECPSDLEVHPYFIQNSVSKWTMESYLCQYPSDADYYIKSIRS